MVYIPFGEVFVEERNGSWTSPYLFNAKELDEETGLYYNTNRQDGVNYFIQHQDKNLLKGKLTGGQNKNLSVTVDVKAGDFIFFRTNSADNGEGDVVEWVPEITYSNSSFDELPETDEKGCDLTTYNAGADFIAGFSSTVTIPGTGFARCLGGHGYKKLKPTLSDVELELIAEIDGAVVGSETIVLRKEETVLDGIAFDNLKYENINGKWLKLTFSVKSELPFDEHDIVWFPAVEIHQQKDTLQVTDTIFVSPARPNYNKLVRIVRPEEVADIPEGCKGDDGHEEEYRIVLKKNLPAEAESSVRTYLIGEEDKEVFLVGTDIDYIPTSVWKGKSVRLVTYSDTPLNSDASVSAELWVNSIEKDKETNEEKKIPLKVQDLQSSIWSHFEGEKLQLGLLYRGWGQFAYKGDEEKNGEKKGHIVCETIRIEELGGLQNKLEADSATLEQMIGDTDGSKLSSNREFISNLFGSATTNLLAPMSYDVKLGRYISSSDISVSELGQTCSRLGKAYIDVEAEIPSYPSETDMQAGMMPAPYLQNKSFASSGTLSGGLKAGFGLSATYSETTQNGRTAYMDLNGDGYPDWISDYQAGLGISYTKTDGTLDSPQQKVFCHLPELKAFSTGGSGSVSACNTEAATQFNKSSWNFTKQNLANQIAQAKNSSSPFSVSLNASGSSCTSASQWDWCDVNGDGLPDIVHKDYVSINLGYQFVNLLTGDYDKVDKSVSDNFSVGLGFCVPLQGSANIGGGGSVSFSDNVASFFLRDVNGDGLPDKVSAINSSVSVGYNVYQNLGLTKGFDATPYFLPQGKLNSSYTHAESMHYNAGATIYFTFVSVTPFYNGSTVLGSHSRTESALNDFDGDGFPDILTSKSEKRLNVRFSRIGATNKLKKVTNPFGGSFTIDYAHTQPTCDHPGGKWAMTGLTVSDAAGSPDIHTGFEYSHGVRDRKERDFLGFGKVVTRAMDGTNTVRTTIQEYDVEHYLTAGALLKTTVAGDDTSVLYRVEETRYAHYGVNGSKLTKNPDLKTAKRLFSVPARKQVTAYEGDTGGLDLSEEVFDYTTDYGNIETYRFKDLTIGGRGYTTEIGYADKRYGTVNRVTVKGDDGQTYREAEATYTNTFTPWAMSTLTRKLDDGQTAHFKFEYDHFGNLTRKESDSTFFTYTYERRYNMYPERVEDAFGYRSEMEDYDFRYGIPLTVRDMNGYTVKYHTDGYGRVDTIVAPNEQSAGAPFTIAYQYVNGNDYKTRCAVTHHYDVQHPDDPVTTVTHVDGLGRPYQVKKEAEIDGSVKYIVSGKQVYDGLGRTIETTHPGTCVPEKALQVADFNTKWLNSSTFDAIDRPLTQTLPGDASGAESTTATAYRLEDGLAVTTVTAPNGNQTSTYTNGAGQTVRMVRDFNGKPVETRFFFDPVGQLDSLIDARGSVTRYTYDMAGRKLSVGHPSAGLTTFKYDVAGNVLEKETENLRAEKKKIEYSYEKNRLKRVTYPNHPENNVTYTYGGVNADFNRVGRVALVEDGSGATEFFYGRMGEVVKQRRTLVIPNVAVATYTTKWKYDSQNRILEMEYP
nr:hypothetical protein [Paludibacteraceae bacterium]